MSVCSHSNNDNHPPQSVSSFSSSAALFPSHYHVLNVPREASYEIIKQAFHKSARQCHPDKRKTTTSRLDHLQCQGHSHTADDLQFQRIQQAWECLRNAQTRSEYDLRLQQYEFKLQARQSSAIEILPCQCRSEQVVFLDELETNDDEDYPIEHNNTTVTDTGLVTILVFTCRCGEEMEIVPHHLMEPHQQSSHQETCHDRRENQYHHLVDCQGCSLTYDTATCLAALSSSSSWIPPQTP